MERKVYRVSLPPDLAEFWDRQLEVMLRDRRLEMADELKSSAVFEALVAAWRAGEIRVLERATKKSQEERANKKDGQ